MEASVGGAASSSLSGRKEWRAVPEQSFRNNAGEDGELVKQGHSDERTIYEDESGPLDVDFCAITIDGELNGEILQRRLGEIVRQREALQHMEIGMKAQIIAQSGISELQSNYEVQLKEQASATSKIKEQLQEREKQLLELELKLEEKDRELRAMKIDTEAAWAKEDLLREQNKELATFRREMDNSEAERMQHLNQIHDLQEHIREKENQLLALEEQHRVAQETILFKDEQLREAQAWIARVQEIDALQSSANQSLQAELRERTEQFNQYWMGFQRQFAEMEHHHMQAIQQLQLELAEARERSDVQKEGSQPYQENATGVSYIQNKGNLNSSSENGPNGTTFSSNGNLDGTSSNGAVASSKTERSPGVAVVPSPMLGMGPFLPPGQVAALHSYLLSTQSVQQTVAATNSSIPQSHLGHFQPMSALPTHQNWLGQQVPIQSKYPTSQTDHELPRSDAQYNLEKSAEQQGTHPEHPSANGYQHEPSVASTDGISEEVQVLQTNHNQLTASQEPQGTLSANAHLNSASEFCSSEQEIKDESNSTSSNKSQEFVQKSERRASSSGVTLSQNDSMSSDGLTEFSEDSVKIPDVAVSSQVSNLFISGKSTEPKLLDERSLLACIVRAIPAGADGRIKISTTLPNRLGKMLAPLHWHDYKKRYGKLDEFVSLHPELFVIEGDFIYLREGAQQIISATRAAAKVAAAAAAAPAAPYASILPSVAVTPIAQINRQKKVQAVEVKAGNTGTSLDSSIATKIAAESLRRQELQNNGVNLNIVQGFSDVNAQPFEMKPSGYSSNNLNARNSANFDRTSSSSSQNIAVANGRHNYVGKQQGRSSGTGLSSRR